MSEELLQKTMTKFIPEITGTQKTVLTYMCLFADKDENNYLCCASVPTLTYHSSIAERTVESSRAKLRELGYISIYADDPGQGRIYKINHKKIAKLKDARITTSITYQNKVRLRTVKKSSTELKINPPERQTHKERDKEKQEKLVLESKELQNLREQLRRYKIELNGTSDRRKKEKINRKIKKISKQIKEEESKSA